ncbi:MAG: VOC family protein [Xanthobacteraceae bacterium]
MPKIKGVAHFSIPVSDVDKSTKFYTEIVGCKFLPCPTKVSRFLMLAAFACC